MGFKEIKRQKYIRKLFESEGMVSVSFLSKKLHISEATIRRDLTKLEDAGVLRRTYGGAVKAEIGKEFEYKSKARKQFQEKRKIAAEAVKQIQKGLVICLDSGSTVFEVAKALKAHPVECSILTNSLPVIQELASISSVRVYLIGGFFRREHSDFFSPYMLDLIKKFSVDIAFLGVDGISASSGLTTTDAQSVAFEEAIIQISSRVVVLADGTKVGKSALLPFGDIHTLTSLISDTSAPNDEIEKLRQCGVETILV